MKGSRLRLFAFLCLLLTGVAGLHAAGSGPLAPPPSAAGIPAWVQTRDPLIASFALVRLLALAMGYYLLFVTLAGTVFRVARMARLASATDLLTIAVVRRVLDGCIGVALIAVVSTPSASGWAAALRPLPVAAAGAPAAAPVMHWLGPEGPVAHSDPAPPPAAAAPAVAPAVATAPTWTIRRGDHLWRVAQATLAAARGRAVTDGEVAPYWIQVVQINRTRLADPDNADLVFIGQVVLLPPVPA